MRIKWNKLGLTHQEIKNIVSGLTHRNSTVTAVYFCPECGAEIYGEWKYTLFYNPQNGNLIERLDTDEDLNAAPIAAGGYVIFVTANAKLLAYK